MKEQRKKRDRKRTKKIIFNSNEEFDKESLIYGVLKKSLKFGSLPFPPIHKHLVLV